MTIIEDVIVEVGGKPLSAQVEQPCTHASFGASVVTADVLGLDGSLERREARVRLRCTECGVPCHIEMSGRPPADGGPGVVVQFRPLDDQPPQVHSVSTSLGGPNAD